MNEYTDIELSAEIFQIVRANQDKTKKEIIKIIKNHFKNEDFEKIKLAIKELGISIKE